MQGQNAKVWERKPPAYSTVSGKDGKRPLLADSGRANLRKVFVNGQRAKEVVWRTTLWPIPGLRELPLPWGGFIGMAVHLHEEMSA